MKYFIGMTDGLVLEALGLECVRSGDLAIAARCFVCACSLSLPAWLESRIRFRYACSILIKLHPALAREQLERALQLATGEPELKRLRVGIVCALSDLVGDKFKALELFGAQCADTTEETIVAYISAFLQASVIYQFERAQSLEMLGGAIKAYPQVRQLRLLYSLYSIIVCGSESSVADLGSICPLGNMLYLINALMIRNYAESDRILSDLVKFKIDTYALNDHVLLFENSFRYIVKSLCIIQSSIDGKTSHSHLLLAGNNVVTSSPFFMKGHIKNILDLIEHMDGHGKTGLGSTLPTSRFNDVYLQAVNVKSRALSDHPYFDYIEFVNACVDVIHHQPENQVKSRLLLVLKHVNTCTQDAFLRAGVMLLLGLMHAESDPVMSQKMLLVADRLGRSCDNNVISSFLDAPTLQ
jgi:hypothetical protein